MHLMTDTCYVHGQQRTTLTHSVVLLLEMRVFYRLSMTMFDILRLDVTYTAIRGIINSRTDFTIHTTCQLVSIAIREGCCLPS